MKIDGLKKWSASILLLVNNIFSYSSSVYLGYSIMVRKSSYIKNCSKKILFPLNAREARPSFGCWLEVVCPQEGPSSASPLCRWLLGPAPPERRPSMTNWCLSSSSTHLGDEPSSASEELLGRSVHQNPSSSYFSSSCSGDRSICPWTKSPSVQRRWQDSGYRWQHICQNCDSWDCWQFCMSSR